MNVYFTLSFESFSPILAILYVNLAIFQYILLEQCHVSLQILFYRFWLKFEDFRAIILKLTRNWCSRSLFGVSEGFRIGFGVQGSNLEVRRPLEVRNRVRKGEEIQNRVENAEFREKTRGRTAPQFFGAYIQCSVFLRKSYLSRPTFSPLSIVLGRNFPGPVLGVPQLRGYFFIAVWSSQDRNHPEIDNLR